MNEFMLKLFRLPTGHPGRGSALASLARKAAGDESFHASHP